MIELARPGAFCRDRMFSCRDRVSPNGEVLCCDRAILCHNTVGQAGKIFCRDKVGQGKGKVCRDRAILCRNRVGKNKENFYHDIGFLGHDRASTRQRCSVAHDRAGCARQICMPDWGVRTVDAQQQRPRRTHNKA